MRLRRPGRRRRDGRRPACTGSVLARTRAPWSTACGGIPWVTSMICAAGRDALDHAVAGADEVVLEAEVGQEADEHGSSLRRYGERRPEPPRRARPTSCVDGLGDERSSPAARWRPASSPGRSRRPASTSPARPAPAPPTATPARRGPRRAGRRPSRTRAVERTNVGAERLRHDQLPCAFRSGEEHTARRVAAAPRAALPASRSPGRGRRHRRRLPSLGRSRPPAPACRCIRRRSSGHRSRS